MNIRPLSASAKIVGTLLGIALLGSGASLAAESQTLAGNPIFTKGEAGYGCFRIPAIVSTKDKSTLLAFAEGRHKYCDDTGDIDVVLKRSTDGGKTWGKVEVVAGGGGDTRGNPVPIVDQSSGRITLLTTYNPGNECPPVNTSKCTRTPYLQHSEDPAGTRWTKPVAQAQLKHQDWDTFFATGPAHGLQLTQGPHKNRMVAGISFSGRNGVKGAGIIVSDDGGTTWKLGAVDDRTGKKINPQEINLLEAVNGDIYAAARNNDNSGTHIGKDNRAAALSTDGGASFRSGFEVVPELKGPVVQGSVERLRATSAGDKHNLILFSGPYNTDPGMDWRRHTMRIRTSTDEGATWQDKGTVIDADWAGYSDLINLGDGHGGLLYEGGQQDSRDSIKFARFTEGDLAH